jgi:hypothetical protein
MLQLLRWLVNFLLNVISTTNAAPDEISIAACDGKFDEVDAVPIDNFQAGARLASLKRSQLVIHFSTKGVWHQEA